MNPRMQSGASGSSVPIQFFRRLFEFLNSLMAPRRLVPIRIRKTHRQVGRAPLVVLAFILLTTGSVWADGKPTLPKSVPDLSNPEVRAQYQPIQVGNAQENPDLPLLMLVNINGENPKALLVGLDARNGKTTWSLSTDPIVLIVLFADPSTITELYLDAGFTRQGAPSGSYQSVPDPRIEMLPDLLRAFSDVPSRTYM